MRYLPHGLKNYGMKMRSNFDVDEKSANVAGNCRMTRPHSTGKMFDVIDLPLGAVFVRRHNKSEKVASPPLVFSHLHDQIRERMHHLHFNPINSQLKYIENIFLYLYY